MLADGGEGQYDRHLEEELNELEWSLIVFQTSDPMVVLVFGCLRPSSATSGVVGSTLTPMTRVESERNL